MHQQYDLEQSKEAVSLRQPRIAVEGCPRLMTYSTGCQVRKSLLNHSNVSVDLLPLSGSWLTVFPSPLVLLADRGEREIPGTTF